MHAPVHAGNLAELVLEKTLKELFYNSKSNSHVMNKLVEGYLAQEVKCLECEIFKQASSDSKFLDGFGL
jgi:hypothetical protein